jgi:hypothetical protein
MPVLDKSFSTLTAVFPFVDFPTGAATTMTAARAAGVSVIAVASATGLTAGDDIRIGSGETMELARVLSIATLDVTLTKPLLFDHAATEPVVEQAALDLGVPEAEGFRFAFNSETTDVFAATQRLAYATLTGYVDLRASFRFNVVTADVFGFALGIPRANIVGNGTAAAQTGTVGPRLFTSNGVTFGAITNVNLVVVGTLQDGSPLRLELYNYSIDPTAVSTTFSRGQLSTVPVSGLASSGALHFDGAAWAPANVISTSASTQGDVFSEITNVQTLTDTGTTTTLGAQATAGGYSVTCASGGPAAASIVAGDWVRVGAEFHLVHSVATNVLNLRTQILATQPNGAVVARQARTTIAGVTGGFTVGNSGSATVQRSEQFRTSLGLKIGNVATTFSFRVNTISPENFYLALGVPASAYANSRLPLGARIASATAQTLLFTGLTTAGKAVTMVGWNGSATVGGEVVLAQAAAMEIPVSYKPAALQVFVNNV